MNNPDISVVIPTLGRAEVLKECLDCLSRQEFKNFEVIIVTDSTDELTHLLDRYRELSISIVQQKSRGLTFARNSGLFSAKGKIVSFIDDDVLVSECWARELLNSFNSQTNVGGLSGPTIIPLERAKDRDILSFHNQKKPTWKMIEKFYTYFVLENQPYSIGKIFKSGAFSLGSNYSESSKLSGEIEVDYLEACNMSYRKAILDNIGGFSPAYRGIGDWSEPDLAFRVREAGYKLVFNPKAAVTHNISQKGVFNQRGKDSCQRMLNFINFYFKWIKPNTLRKAVGFGTNLIFLNMYWCYKYLQTRNSYWLYGLWGTIKGLSRELLSGSSVYNN